MQEYSGSKKHWSLIHIWKACSQPNANASKPKDTCRPISRLTLHLVITTDRRITSYTLALPSNALCVDSAEVRQPVRSPVLCVIHCYVHNNVCFQVEWTGKVEIRTEETNSWQWTKNMPAGYILTYNRL